MGIHRFHSIKTIFNSTANTLCKPISLENFSELSAVLAVTAAATANINNINTNNNKEATDDDIKMNDGSINISNITDISSVNIPQIESEIYNKNRINNKRIMPDINILSNMPKYAKIFNDSNPAIQLPKLPLPPPPPHDYGNWCKNGIRWCSDGINNGIKWCKCI